LIELRVSDVRQFEYCPRGVFYDYVMPVDRVTSYKMEHGQKAEEAVGRLEKRRALRRYGLADATRRFHVNLTSERLGLTGRVDMILETPEAVYPLDFKETTEGIRQSHKLQLCAYGLMLEENMGRPAPFGFVYLIPSDKVVKVAFDEALRRQTIETVNEIRRFIAEERMPDPTPLRAKCVECEFRNYCGDVF
jgi:CRISPR-associated exonuclease Cas4